MPVSAATAGYGCVFKRGATAIAEVVNISGPGLKLDTIDVTNMGSPNATREFIAGLLDGGEVTLEINFLPADATQKSLITDLTSRTKTTYSIVWSDTAPTTWTFTALVTGYEPGGKVDDKLSATVTLKISGLPTIP
jgi:hypothetical protein